MQNSTDHCLVVLSTDQFLHELFSIGATVRILGPGGPHLLSVILKPLLPF